MGPSHAEITAGIGDFASRKQSAQCDQHPCWMKWLRRSDSIRAVCSAICVAVLSPPRCLTWSLSKCAYAVPHFSVAFVFFVPCQRRCQLHQRLILASGTARGGIASSCSERAAAAAWRHSNRGLRFAGGGRGGVGGGAAPAGGRAGAAAPQV